MSSALTCWKEIASYLGKSVRTVQRWERELDLPVRRPNEHEYKMVAAIPAELDNWVQTRLTPHPTAHAHTFDQLQKTVRLVSQMKAQTSKTNDLVAQMLQLSTLKALRCTKCGNEISVEGAALTPTDT